MKILIVDDSKAMRTFLTALVQDMKLETAQAEDGCNALEVLKGDPVFQLALVDWDMPNMNGLEFVKAVRANTRYNQLKLMMVTTQNSIDRVVAALDAGATDYLMKPVSRQSLEEKLRLLRVIV